MNRIQRDDHIVSGYIHDKYVEEERAVPTDVIGLCYKYYHTLFEKIIPSKEIDIDSPLDYPLIALNDTDIIIIPENNYFHSTKGIYKYNIESKQYELFIEFTQDFEIAYHTAAYDRKNQIIYIRTGTGICKVNINQKSLSCQELTHIGIRPQSVFARNKFHVIGGSRNSSHLIWNDNDQRFDEIYNLNTHNLWQGRNRYAFGLVHVPENHHYNIPETMVMFGGFDGMIQRDMYYFSFGLQKWILMDLKLSIRQEQNSYVLTADGRYILMFDFSEIQRLDLKDFPNIKQQEIKLDEGDQIRRNKCVLMNNGDIHFINCNNHHMTNVNDILSLNW